MNYFMLPQLYNETCENNINIVYNGPEQVKINVSLNIYLNQIKKHIDILEETGEWNIFKKYTNPYEYIHTTLPEFKRSICTFRPISRSYFKLIEIIHAHDLNDTNDPIQTFHLAEGPGGFIEAMCNIRSNRNDTYYGMTLINSNPDVPGWKKSDNVLKSFPNIYIEKGSDGTGDLFNIENLIYCKKKYSNKMHIITADGGFDFSVDFNKQEEIGFNLIYAQVCYAIIMQKQYGHFILKVFDCFTKATSDLLYLLNTLYHKVYIMKPETSRYANSEKYIICKYFKNPVSETLLNNLLKNYHFIRSKNITNILTKTKPVFFMNKLIEYNSIFGQQQVEHISYTLALINNKKDDEKINALKKINVYKCIKWCKKYKQPYNNISL